MRALFRRRNLIWGVVAAAALSAWPISVLRRRVIDNVGVVEDGSVYRAGQLDGQRLAEVIEQHNIRTVLNLRGAHRGEAWYDEEVRVSRELGVAHHDRALHPHQMVPPAEADELLELLKTAEKPILLHCGAGADRTGLLSALYRLQLGDDPDTAVQQLEKRYLHLPFSKRDASAMDESFWLYVRTSSAPPSS